MAAIGNNAINAKLVTVLLLLLLFSSSCCGWCRGFFGFGKRRVVEFGVRPWQVLLGDMGAGKSSLVLRFVKGQFLEFQVLILWMFVVIDAFSFFF